MKISRHWLSEFVQLDPAQWPNSRIASVLTDLGLEVEHVDDQAAALHRFVVGRVLTREPHPKADKLSVCTVDVGEAEPRTICCGAANVAAGQTVPVAIDGAVVPNGGFTIGKRMLRGVESNGMICSQTELNLGDEGDGIWVLTVDHPSGTPLAEALGLTDTIFDVFTTPNRADCNSHIGIARDLAAYAQIHGGGTLAPRAAHQLPQPLPPTHLIGTVDATLAPRYALQRIQNVRIQPSPEWMQQRLLAMGLRPRNVVVDVTNYVNMELGQPLHAFDYSKIRGGRIDVHTVATGTPFVTLDGKERTLNDAMLMIYDQEGPVAIAGVMGGQNSEIDDHTTDIVLESAFFLPSSIRRTAKTLGLNTDASYRFERGIDIGNVLGALQRATELIVELAGGSAGPVEEVYPTPAAPAPIHLRYERMRAINGIDVSDDAIRTMLSALGCAVREVDATACEVIPPTWRVDITAEIDLAEEVMRLHGINNVPASEWSRLNITGSTLPASVQAGGGRERMARRQALRTQLAARSYADCITAVLTSPDLAAWGLPSTAAPVQLRNALGREFSALRTSLLPGLLGSVARNLRYGASTIRLAEIGNVFTADALHELSVRQHELCTLVVTGTSETHWSSPVRPLDVYDVLGDLQLLGPVTVHHLSDADRAGLAQAWSTNAVALHINGTRVGVVGQIHPDLAAAFDIERPVFAAELSLRDVPLVTPHYRPVNSFPAVHRDVAMIVDEAVQAATIIDTVRAAAGEYCIGASVFDVYRDDKHVGVGKKSIAVSLTFQHAERTLVDADVDSAMEGVIAAAQASLNATVRGTS